MGVILIDFKEKFISAKDFFKEINCKKPLKKQHIKDDIQNYLSTDKFLFTPYTSR